VSTIGTNQPPEMKIEPVPENARHSRDTPRWPAARHGQPSIVHRLRASRLGDWYDRLDLRQFFVFRFGIKRGKWFAGIFDAPFDSGDVMVSGTIDGIALGCMSGLLLSRITA
jgi:hypothetical protein